MDVLEHLTHEHRKAERLLAQLAESEEGSEREQALSELESSLDTHMAVEEQFVYPIVQDVMGSEEEQGAETEHELTRDGLAKLRELVAAPGFGAAVDMLKGGLAHHVEEEEQEIFPKLRSEAMDRIVALGPPEELEQEVEQRGSRRGSSSKGSSSKDEPTKQELYEKAKAAHIEGRSHMSKKELEEAVANA